MMNEIIDLTELSFVSGPIALPEPAFSFADDWIGITYSAAEAAAAILGVEGVKMTSASTADWESWTAK